MDTTCCVTHSNAWYRRSKARRTNQDLDLNNERGIDGLAYTALDAEERSGTYW